MSFKNELAHRVKESTMFWLNWCNNRTDNQDVVYPDVEYLKPIGNLKKYLKTIKRATIHGLDSYGEGWFPVENLNFEPYHPSYLVAIDKMVGGMPLGLKKLINDISNIGYRSINSEILISNVVGTTHTRLLRVRTKLSDNEHYIATAFRDACFSNTDKPTVGAGEPPYTSIVPNNPPSGGGYSIPITLFHEPKSNTFGVVDGANTTPHINMDMTIATNERCGPNPLEGFGFRYQPSEKAMMMKECIEEIQGYGAQLYKNWVETICRNPNTKGNMGFLEWVHRHTTNGRYVMHKLDLISSPLTTDEEKDQLLELLFDAYTNSPDTLPVQEGLEETEYSFKVFGVTFGGLMTREDLHLDKILKKQIPVEGIKILLSPNGIPVATQHQTDGVVDGPVEPLPWK